MCVCVCVCVCVCSMLPWQPCVSRGRSGPGPCSSSPSSPSPSSPCGRRHGNSARAPRLGGSRSENEEEGREEGRRGFRHFGIPPVMLVMAKHANLMPSRSVSVHAY